MDTDMEIQGSGPVVVTGGARGIGAATVERVARTETDVVIADTLVEEGTATADRVASTTGQTVSFVETDVADDASVAQLATIIADEFDCVAGLVNNAGIRVEPLPVTQADEASWDHILAVNLRGPARCAKRLIPLMTDGGCVVNVASNGADVARPAWSQYDATKGALISMTRDMACDHAVDDVRVNALSPGYVVTEYHMPEEDPEGFRADRMTPNPDGPGIVKRAAHPDEIAGPITFLLSTEASFMTGTNVKVDGGVTAVGKGLSWAEYHGELED